MALPRIGFNEGSLLRRTLIHVGTFVLGSAAFIGVASFVLVSIAKGLVAPAHAEAAEEEPATVASAGPKVPAAASPFVRPGGVRPGARRPSLPMTPPIKND